MLLATVMLKLNGMRVDAKNSKNLNKTAYLTAGRILYSIDFREYLCHSTWRKAKIKKE